MPAWAPFLLTLIGGSGIGGFVVAWWNQRTSTKQWRRDRQLDAYAEFARGATTLNGAFADFLNATSADKAAARERFDRTLYELDGAYARVALIGAEAVAQAAAGVLDHTMGNLVPLTGPADPPPAATRDVVLTTNRERYEAFVNRARQQLGSEKLRSHLS